MSHDIGDSRSSLAHVEVRGLESPTGHHRDHPRGRTVAEIVNDYNVSKSWVYELLARFRDEGDTALEPRSRRPHTSPNATPPEVVDLILQIRKDLADRGLDAGADTIDWHLIHHHAVSVSRATIHAS